MDPLLRITFQGNLELAVQNMAAGSPGGMAFDARLLVCIIQVYATGGAGWPPGATPSGGSGASPDNAHRAALCLAR